MANHAQPFAHQNGQIVRNCLLQMAHMQFDNDNVVHGLDEDTMYWINPTNHDYTCTTIHVGNGNIDHTSDVIITMSSDHPFCIRLGSLNHDFHSELVNNQWVLTQFDMCGGFPIIAMPLVAIVIHGANPTQQIRIHHEYWSGASRAALASIGGGHGFNLVCVNGQAIHCQNEHPFVEFIEEEVELA